MNLPNPLDFVTRTLDANGGLTERDGDDVNVLLPLDLAARLSVPDLVALRPDDTATWGLGSPLLESLVEIERSKVPFATAASGLLPPRPSGARALAEAFVIRNGVASIRAVEAGFAWYAVVAVAWTMEADERYEGVEIGGISAEDGARPPVALHDDPDLATQDPIDPGKLEDLGPWIRRLASELEAPGPSMALTARRHVREHERIAAYYADLIAEARRPSRKVDPEAIAAKVAHLLAERDARLGDLVHRYAPRVSSRLAGLLLLSVPVVRVTLVARRRKASRDLVLRLVSGARQLDHLPCAGCLGWIAGGIALCDARLHELCERCVPESSGRPACPACGDVSRTTPAR